MQYLPMIDLLIYEWLDWFVIPKQELTGNENTFQVAIWVHMCEYVSNCKLSHFIQFNWTNFGKQWKKVYFNNYFSLVPWCKLWKLICDVFFSIHFVTWTLYKSHDHILKLEDRNSVGSRKHTFIHLDCLHRLIQSPERVREFQSSHVKGISL